jgi:HTH-type transcriptional regulator / antitoxin HigA
MMDIRALHTETDYDWALKEVEKYFDDIPTPGSEEADRFDVLSALIKDYEIRNMELPDADPIDVLNFAIGSMGKSQAELGHLIGRSRATEILKRRRPLTLDMIREISKAWHLPIETLTAPYELAKKYA